MNELGRLITERMAKERLTYDAVAEKGGIPKGTVWALVHRDIKAPPRIDTVERLALGLGLPVDVVADAAAAATGYRKERVSSSDPNVQIIAAAAERLGEEERATLAAIAEAFVSAMDARNTK